MSKESPQEPTAAPLLVTGGAGFIGSNLVRRLLGQGRSVINLDALTYAGRPESMADFRDHPAHEFVQGDIRDGRLLADLFAAYQPGAVINLAAESHVDRSIDAPAAFVDTNVVGTSRLLEAALAYWEALPAQAKARFRFLQTSTDEVYGSAAPGSSFTETTPYGPNSPYAASKAAADHMVRAFHRTYGLPTLTTCCSNNYGPYQFPEKLIPLAITKALQGEAIPVYGDGQQRRDWLHVSDHCAALTCVLEEGRPGESYLIGCENEIANIDLLRALCGELDAQRPDAAGSYARLITPVPDRPGHDRRYAIDPGKLLRETSWRPGVSFEEGLRQTVTWYLGNEDWVEAIKRTGTPGARLGLRGLSGEAEGQRA